MTSIPSNLARVPNLLSSQLILSNLQRTNQELLNTQTQLASGKQLNRPSDDAVGSSTVSVLDDFLERRDQRLRNLSHADSVLGNVDSGLADATDILIEAKAVGLSQVGIGSDAQTRKNQAAVIDSILSEMTNIANRKYQDIHLFGGSSTAQQPFAELLAGIQYTGTGDGLSTDLGFNNNTPITVSGDESFGALSSRVSGQRDLDPAMLASTRLVDLEGARGQGISPGTITVTINDNQESLDLSEVETVGDVSGELETLLQGVDPGATVGIDPLTNDRFTISTSATVTISDPGPEATAADLGLSGTVGPGTFTGEDVNPLLTELTPVSSLSGVSIPPGMIRITNGGQSKDVDLSGIETIQDFQNTVRGLNLGVRVEIAESGDRINMINELSGSEMSIGEVAGGKAATQLGIRSLSSSTRLDAFNNGQGVEILTGAVDPLTGAPDPAGDLDFRVVTNDGTQFDVDLAGAETVQDVLNKINASAAAAGLNVNVAGDYFATLADDGNGLMFYDNTPSVNGGVTTVESLNGSHAAEDLGILGEGSGGARFNGEDRATVAADSVFSHLISLRDALTSDDERGIELATEKLENDISRVTEARAEVGVRSRRVSAATTREEGLKLQDTELRSSIADLDYTEASVRFANLQQQLQAGLTSASQATQLSLLDFLR